MAECAGYSKPPTSELARPCPYPPTEAIVLSGERVHACYFHAKVYRGEITDAGTEKKLTSDGRALLVRELSWSPRRHRQRRQIPELTAAEMLEILRREWADRLPREAA